MAPSVLHVTQPTHAGVARCVLDLVPDQVRRGWHVTVASPDTDDFGQAVADRGAAHHIWNAARPPGPSTLSEMQALQRIVALVDPDLVHLHSSKAGLAGRLALRGRRPTVFQPNGWSFFAVDGLRRTAAQRWERSATRWTTTLVCVSQREKDDGAVAGVNAPWRVVPNAVDVERFTPADRGDARSALGLHEAPHVVCVGRLSRQKGQDTLLDAWPLVREAVPHARLVLVGDGPDRAALGARAGSRADDDVTFAGGRDDVHRWLSAADVVALPSRWEGMSYVMLEAMASGRSVVAFDVGGASEAIGADGQAGALVPPDDVRGLAAALVERLRHPEVAAREGLAGVRRARATHDLRRWWDRMHEVAIQALGDGVAGTIAV